MRGHICQETSGCTSERENVSGTVALCHLDLSDVVFVTDGVRQDSEAGSSLSPHPTSYFETSFFFALDFVFLREIEVPKH